MGLVVGTVLALAVGGFATRVGLDTGAFWTAIAHAYAAMRVGDHDTAMRQLERAHILGQRQLGPHLHVHWLMLRVELRRRSASAALGQVARLILGIVGNLVGVLPTGNRDSSHVSMFRKEPIPTELAVLLKEGDLGR